MTEQNTPKMTHDEMIDVLKGLVFGTFDRTTAKEREALDMAISALSAPSANVISINQANAMIKSYVSHYEENKGEWIPVTERLPEEREWYLAVFKEKDTDFQLIPRVADYIGHGENKWQWIDEEGIPQEYFDLLECVAWMPLPEPYKGG